MHRAPRARSQGWWGASARSSSSPGSSSAISSSTRGSPSSAGFQPAYSYDGTRAKLGVVYTLTNHLSITPSYNLEWYHLESGTAQLGGTAPTLLFGCPTDCVLSYAEETVEWD